MRCAHSGWPLATAICLYSSARSLFSAVMAWVACERCARGTLEASCIATSPLWVKPMAPDANKPCRVEWKRLRMRASIAWTAGVCTSRFAGSAALAAGITASRISMASGGCCAGSLAPEDGGVLLAGAGAAPALPGPMMLLMTWSAAFCAAAAGKYTLMVTQPASNASVVARANRGLRIMDLRVRKRCHGQGDRLRVYTAVRQRSFGVRLHANRECRRASFDHRRVAFGHRLQAADQRRPVHRALVPDHGDVRQAAAFHDRVAVAVRVRIGRDPAHAAYALHQRAAQADSRITEGLEQAQRHALQSAGDAAAADLGEALDGILSDLAAAVRCQVGLERDGFPVDQFEPVDVSIDAPRDLSEPAHAGELGKVELVHVDVGLEFGRIAERVLHAQIGDTHRTAEGVK